MDKFKPDSKIEKKEQIKDIKKVSFDRTHFNGLEIKRYPSENLSGYLNEWLADFYIKNNIDASSDLVREFGYHMIRLAITSLENADGGDVSVLLGDKSLTAVIRDNGEGIQEVQAFIEEFPSEDLPRVLSFADKLTLETLGKKYIKNRKGVLEETKEAVPDRGNVIAFSKVYK